MIGLLVYLGVVVVLLIGSTRKPAFSLGASLCMFGLEQWGAAKIGYIATHGSFSNYMSFVVVIFGLSIQVYRRRKLRIGNGPIHLLVVLLFAYSAASLLWTPAPAIAMEEWRAAWPYVLMTVFFLPLLVQDVNDASDGLFGTLVAGAILALALTFLANWSYRSIVSDVGGVIRLPLAIGQLGAYVFILTIAFMRWRGFYALLAIGLLVVSVILVVKTGSRGQLIAMLVTGTLLAPMARGTSVLPAYIPGAVIVATVLLAVWLMFPNIFGFLSEQGGRFETERAVEDYEERIMMARALFDAYMSSDVMGLLFGLGTSASFSPRIAGFYPHIVPIEVLCELGVVGIALLIAILVLTLRSVIRYMRRYAALETNRKGTRVVMSLAALFILEVLLSLKQGSLLRNANLLMFPILIEGISLGAAAAYQKYKRAERRLTEPLPTMQASRTDHV